MTVTRLHAQARLSKSARAASRVAVPSGSSARPEALEGRPQLGPAGDVHAARAVDPQPELVLVLVGDAAAEGRGEKEDRGEAGSMGPRILAEVESRAMAARRRRVYLIDGSAQFHRAYFAIRGLATSRGLPTNATYGFTTMLRKLYEDEKPEYVGISFDLPGPTFRHEEYKEYKAHRAEDGRRPRGADSLRAPGLRGLPAAHPRRPRASRPTTCIATLARQAVEQGMRVVVVSGDKDLLQLVADDVLVLNPGREGRGPTLYDRKKVEEKFGVPPERVVDVLALVGDAVDNVPGRAGHRRQGRPGPGPRVRLRGGRLDNADEVKRAAYREGLKTHREEALLSKRLVTLRSDVPVSLDLRLSLRASPTARPPMPSSRELEFLVLAKEYAPDAAPRPRPPLRS